MPSYKLLDAGVIRDDGAIIPPTPGNRDWDDYRAWLKIGNLPIPKDPPAPPSANEVDAQNARADADVQVLAAMTPAQAMAWVQTNVNTVADAKQFMKRVAAVLCVLARRI